MHICLNFAGGSSWMGGAIYVQNLAYAISNLRHTQHDKVKLSIAVSKSNLKLVEPVKDYIDELFVNKSLFLKGGKFLAERLNFAPLSLLNPLKVDFVYPTFAGKRSPYTWGGWIPDFQHHYLPQLFSEQEIAGRDDYHAKIAENAPVIVLSSQMALDHFKNRYPSFAHKAQLLTFATYIDPAYLEPDPVATQRKYDLPDHFFMVSNQFWKHKDHSVISKALSILKRQGVAPTVVFTGNTQNPSGSTYLDQLLTEIQTLQLDSQIKILGLIPRIDQIQLMRRCLAVIQPSLFEGWSTLVEDSRTLGKPIILSDFPVHFEQNPPKAYFFERSNPEALASRISTALDALDPGPNYQDELAARQENAERLLSCGQRFFEIVSNVI